MTFLFSALLFILGTLVGSFLNVCIYRLPLGMSVAHPPSHCPRCNTRLVTRDLLPLVSQAVLGGRCRYCCAPIAWRYAGIEFLTGVLFVLAGRWAGPFINEWNYVVNGDWIKLLQGLIFMATLVVIFWVDYDTRLIPLEAVFLLGLAGVARDAWVTISTRGLGSENTGLTGGGWLGLDILPAMLPGSLWAMAVVSATLWMLREVFSRIYGKEALGFGDVILVGAIAANLGWNGTLWTFAFASVVLGASVGLLLQVPRAIRARRWARARAHKYLQRAQKAREPSAPLADALNGAHEGAAAEAEAARAMEAQAREREWAQARARYWQQAGPLLGRHAFRRAMPFGPMLAIGAIVALLWGARLNSAYMNAVGYSGPSASMSEPSFD